MIDQIVFPLLLGGAVLLHALMACLLARKLKNLGYGGWYEKGTSLLLSLLMRRFGLRAALAFGLLETVLIPVFANSTLPSLPAVWMIFTYGILCGMFLLTLLMNLDIYRRPRAELDRMFGEEPKPAEGMKNLLKF